VGIKFDIALLYVEDEDIVRNTMGTFFRRRFRDVYFAQDGEEGLSVYKEMKPDIIITDIEMPKLDGLKMSEAIRALDADVPIIFTTAYNEQEHVEAATKLGVSAYLEKPISYDELDDIIVEAMDKIRSK